ncbi:MAG: pyruvate carboxylase subunit B [Planctomycetota bacterium]|nr:pyruvate carboxylase subunit B [Planctomycetota bacterium]
MSGKSSKERVFITETVLRDGHQSLFATRMRTDDMLPALEAMDDVGYWSLEVWGGATFEVAMRYLNENPWERLRKIRSRVKKTRLQMLLRGQNLVGYRHYPDDVVERFIELAAENGIDVFRIFDALNDVRNMECAIQVVKRLGKHAEGTLSYTLSPVHTIGSFVETAKRLRDLGCDTICIKDMAGLLGPFAAEELVGALVKEVGLPVHMHCHTTSGLAQMAYLEGVKAGARIIDCAISPFAGGTSQPAVCTMVAAFAGTPYDTGLNLLGPLEKVAEHFSEVRKRLEEEVGRPEIKVDAAILNYQIPGGMMSNLVSQLKEQNALQKLGDVLEEVPKVRADLGYPPLVTPTSQIVGTQAALNVILGQRYKVVLEETKNLIRGLYGRTPGPVNEELKRRVLGKEEAITCRPADLLSPMLEEAKRAKGVESDEDAVTYALFPQNWDAYIKARKNTSGG